MPQVSHTALECSNSDSYSPWQFLHLTSFPLHTRVEDTPILALCAQNGITECWAKWKPCGHDTMAGSLDSAFTTASALGKQHLYSFQLAEKRAKCSAWLQKYHRHSLCYWPNAFYYVTLLQIKRTWADCEKLEQHEYWLVIRARVCQYHWCFTKAVFSLF